MAHHLIVVEGSHDAAFFGRLLRTRGFKPVANLGAVPTFWLQTIPRAFPVRADQRLERIMPFPEILVHPDTGDTVGIDVARSDSALLAALRTALDLYEAADFASLSLVLDTDWEMSEAERFAAFSSLLPAWNAAAVQDDRPGFPLTFPTAPNSIHRGAPHVGVYLLPGGGQQGTLETILLECAELQHPELHRNALNLVDLVHQSAHYPSDAKPDVLKSLRKPSGKAKAQCGVIGNVFNPGASLSVSLRDAPWLPDNEADIACVKAAAFFIDELLRPGV